MTLADLQYGTNYLVLVIHNPDSLHESSDLQDSVAFHDTVMTVIRRQI